VLVFNDVNASKNGIGQAEAVCSSAGIIRRWAWIFDEPRPKRRMQSICSGRERMFGGSQSDPLLSAKDQRDSIRFGNCPSITVSDHYDHRWFHIQPSL
jgi:hypothetical protein